MIQYVIAFSSFFAKFFASAPQVVSKIMAQVSILKLGGDLLLIKFSENFQIEDSYLVNSEKVVARPPPCPPSNVGPAVPKIHSMLRVSYSQRAQFT